VVWGNHRLGGCLSKAKFFEWLAKLIAANVNFAGIPPLVVMAALVLFSLAVRYLFASMAAYVAACFPSCSPLPWSPKFRCCRLFFLLPLQRGMAACLPLRRRP